MLNSWYAYLRDQCDEGFGGVGLNPVHKQTIFNVLQRIGSKPVTYKNAFPMKKKTLLLENQVKYVEDMIVKIYTANLGMSRNEVIQVISELGQAN